ncbi:MAG: glycosyltransferase [Chryseobacterium sp.]|uniref:glycosyltransferase family 2 protein n=1 Tax=Chryseobacterium sp. TaxID=1871047 RepID=UPI0025B83946|nr:glycosyltransferase family 2 protein [Chryseobacterium sp.]MCJ7934316.1 glycosyltransferase [Chryseobacterium sp.]
MKFSILIAHFNNAAYFKACYESIIQQTFTDWEVIIVDDCSKEAEKEALKQMISDDSRFFLYENDTNRGTGYTKKRCAELATGEICGFLDPDDALTPDALEESIKAYSKYDIVGTYSRFYLCDEHLAVEKLFPHSGRIKNRSKYFFNINFNVAHFFTFKRKIYTTTEKIDETLTSSVDQDLYLKLHEKGNLFFINKSLYLYRLHAQGISQNKRKKEKLYKNWHTVLYNTLRRRKIKILYKKDVQHIECLPNFIFEKQNTLFTKFLRKITKGIYSHFVGIKNVSIVSGMSLLAPITEALLV